MPDFAAHAPARTLVGDTVGHEEDDVTERYAVRLTGELFVADAGEHVFYTNSDDGSELFVDGVRIVDNDGIHPQQREDGSATLDAGWHDLEVTFFENGGDALLEAGWVVDVEDEEEDDTQPFDSDELRTTMHIFEPRGWELIEPDADLAARGRVRFASLGCVACHALDGIEPKPTEQPLDQLLWLEDGCLADVVPSGLPDYHLDDTDRDALREVLRGAPALTQPLDEELVVDRALARLDCLACHARNDAPGPQGEVRAAFSSTADLGDEGRFPPDLTGVGAKLRTGALHDVLVDNARVRPYMLTRMPHFGEAAVGHLPEAFSRADGAGPSAVVSSTSERLEAGRLLAGTDGLSCISCHTVAGQASIGVPGMDLAVMHERLRSQWFRRWMREPLAMRSGTRMPTFFEQGRSVLGSVLDGDSEAQIGALWEYLGLGSNLPLPAGVVVDRAAYQLVAVERPVYVGAFMEGLSARVLNVGFPENVHVAFDSQHVRLARAWSGRFFDAEGTWRGRAGRLELPPGDRVVELPAGPAFALLAQRDTTPWPTTEGKAAGWRMLGHVRDEAGFPTFRYGAVDENEEPMLLVEESPRPAIGVGRAVLVRHFDLHIAPGTPPPVMRAWTGSKQADSIHPVPGEPGTWKSTDGVVLVLRGADGYPRSTDDGTELLVVPRGSMPLDLPRNSSFEVELRW